MRMRVGVVGLGVLMPLSLSACGASATPADPSSPPSTSATTPSGNSSAPVSGESPSSPAATGSTTPTLAGDAATARAAIETAQAADNGIAHAIDDQDSDGTWEVDVMVGDRSIDYTVSADGTSVTGRDDTESMDADEKRALDGAQVTIIEAIDIATAQHDAVLDDVDLDEHDKRWVWEVSLQGHDDVLVDIATGEIVPT